MRWEGAPGLLPVLLALLGLSAIPLARLSRPAGADDAAKDEPAPAPLALPPQALRADLCASAGVMCSEASFQKLTARVHALLAMAPDPGRSELALSFDEMVDALVASAEQAGFVRQHFRLLPHERASPQPRLANPCCSEAKEDSAAPPPPEPGWLIFRRGKRALAEAELLLIFLVPESPKLGIDRTLFDRAYDYALQQGPVPRAGPEPKILGPFFSGSALSLWRALQDRGVGRKQVITGSATGELDPPGQIELQRTVVPDAQMLAFVLRQLVAEDASDPVQIAILSESTAYGDLQSLPAGLSDTAAPTDIEGESRLRVRRYRFPPGISQVRAARAAERKHNPEDDTLRRTLRLKLDQGEQSSTDTLPSLAKLSPFATELSLRATLREIARRNVRYLLVVATNLADLLFLAGEARVYCPRARIVTLGSHVLLSHPDVANELSGMLIGTSYPLLLENQAWTQASGQPAKSFANDSAQGVYNALQWLLREKFATPYAPLDYCPVPARQHVIRGPAMWFTEVQNGRFWPLRIASGSDAAQRDAAAPGAPATAKPSFPPCPKETKQMVRSANRSARSTHLLSGVGLLWLLLGALQLVVFVSERRGARWPARVPIVRLFVSRDHLGSVGRQYRACAHLTHGFFGMGVALVMIRLYALHASMAELMGLAGLGWLGLGVAVALIVAGLAELAPAITADLEALRRSAGGGDRRRRSRLVNAYPRVVSLAVALFAVALACVAVWAFAHLALALLGSSSRLLLVRLSDPLGMSALMPLMFAAAGLYAWATIALSRVSAIDRFPPKTPMLESPELFVAARLSDNLMQRSHYWRARIWSFELALVALFALASTYLWFQLHPTFEWHGFEALVKAALLALASTVLFAALQGSVLWNSLRRLLVLLVATPMADAYDRIGLKVTSTFGLHLRSHVPNADELFVSLRSCETLAFMAKRISERAEQDVMSALPTGAPVPESGAAADRQRSEALATIMGPLAETLMGVAAKLTRQLDPCGRDRAETGPQAEASGAAPAVSATDGNSTLSNEAAPAPRGSDVSDPHRTREAHALFFDASRALARALQELWKLRAQYPSVAGIEDAIAVEKLLVTGDLGLVPTAAVLGLWETPELRVWVRSAEDFVAMRNATFIYHAIDQIRRCLGAALVGALCCVFAAFSYPLQPPRFVAVSSGLVLMGAAAAALRVIVAMERNELLRRLAGMRNQQSLFNANFFTQLFVYVGIPVTLLLARSFPEFSDAISGLLQPLWALLQ